MDQSLKGGSPKASQEGQSIMESYSKGTQLINFNALVSKYSCFLVSTSAEEVDECQVSNLSS